MLEGPALDQLDQLENPHCDDRPTDRTHAEQKTDARWGSLVLIPDQQAEKPHCDDWRMLSNE